MRGGRKESVTFRLRKAAGGIVRDVLDRGASHICRHRREMPILQVAVLYVYADTQRYPGAEAAILRVFEWHRGVEFIVVSIDNWNSEKGIVSRADGQYDIGGDNTWWEFSGWEKGLRFVTESLGANPDVIVCVNDAFLNLSDRGYDLRHFRRAFRPSVLWQARSGFVGSMCKSDTNCECLGNDVSTWIQTNFFAMPFSVAQNCLGPCLSSKQIDAIIDRNWVGRIFRPSMICNDELKEFLTTWITMDWERSSIPTAQSWPFIRMKLIAILNERLLSASVRKAGVPLVDLPLTRWWQVARDW